MRGGVLDPDVDRAGDLARVAAERRAVGAERPGQVEPVLRVLGEHVPLLRPAGRGPQGAGPAAPADGDRRVGPLHRLGLAAGLGEPDVLSVQRGRLLGEQGDDRLHALIEAVEALLQRRQLDAVGVAFQLVPAGAQAQFQPAAGDDVGGRGHVRQHGGMPVDHAGHLAADPDPAGGLRERGEHGPPFQVRPGEVARERVEVVPVPGRLEQADLVGRLPYVQDPCPRGVLRPGLDREAHRLLLSGSGSPGRGYRGGPGRCPAHGS